MPEIWGGLDHSWNEEFYQVHWLRAKALQDRWKEELILVELEMDWTCNFFLLKSNAMGRLDEGIIGETPSGSCLLLWKAIPMYSLLAQDAQAAFQDLQSMLIDARDE
ncbi:uncharacterized protein EDB91DRAFT_1086999 [Suillus paluster]|uniref:uncharacterized protein n=1 Tax=Suillus paluster TaxID=48578 RepID=UPI001B886803|nr:uncharacterized protein EDB91DRAFT_1086999 [Suillus paluster]KAG1725682.1 hypothetical protein EDB91DRAFT_1086999 [Suillus paluster]